jgi:hypothetical protein
MERFTRTTIVLTLSSVALATTLCAADTNGIPAFPGATGAGMFTVGGRFGSVYRVTNLNATGPGSFADAVSQSNRIVVFTVSGIIDLSKQKETGSSAPPSDGKEGKRGKGGKIVIDQPNITIAGQTAPGEGICLKGGALQVEAGEVIVRYLRSRRGVVAVGDQGDAFDIKPPKTEVDATGEGTTDEAFKKKLIKKTQRGKVIKEPARVQNIILDHLSASWATDENMSVTHPNFTTAQWCIAAEGLDYTNPKQTPPNHSEGSLWGVSWPDGRSTMDHVLYAHNRLRNPRTTGGHMPPAVLEFRNSVVYDCSEHYSHTGSEAVHLNWLDNYYKYGPNTPAELRGNMFEFVKSPESRMYASGNFLEGFPDRSQDNWLAITVAKGLTESERQAMRVDQPFKTVAAPRRSAQTAYEEVLADSGATLPARDSVDLRIVNEVRYGTGRIIQKETDLPPDQRWPDYRSLPAPVDSDADGLPDYWEDQFGLNRNDASDAMKISAGGYANIEHYINNTDPTGGATPIVYIAGAVSRAHLGTGEAGVLRVTRTGDPKEALTIRYTVGGEAAQGTYFARLSGSVTIPSGAASADILVSPQSGARDNRTVTVSLTPANPVYHVGCPSAALVVIRK